MTAVNEKVLNQKHKCGGKFRRKFVNIFYII